MVSESQTSGWTDGGLMLRHQEGLWKQQLQFRWFRNLISADPGLQVPSGLWMPLDPQEGLKVLRYLNIQTLITSLCSLTSDSSGGLVMFTSEDVCATTWIQAGSRKYTHDLQNKVNFVLNKSKHKILSYYFKMLCCESYFYHWLILLHWAVFVENI